MKKEIETKFWEFRQNNSGGYCIENEKNGVCESVIIEATTPEEAWAKLEEIGIKVNNFWDYCRCCGERWSNSLDETDGKEVPMHYNTPVEKVKEGLFRSRSFVHYYDGTIKKFNYKN